MNNYLDDLDVDVQRLTNSYPPNRPIRPIPLIAAAARGVKPVIHPVNRVPYMYVPKVASVEKLIRELTKVKNIIDSPETSCDTAQQILKEFDTNYMYIFKHIEKNPRYFDNPDVISQLRALEISIQNKSRKCIESKLINMYKQIFDIRGGDKRKKRNSIRLRLCSKRRKNKNKTNKKRRSRRVF
jgi:hypothetical protein